VQNYQLGVLRVIPGGKGRLAERLRRQNKRLTAMAAFARVIIWNTSFNRTRG